LLLPAKAGMREHNMTTNHNAAIWNHLDECLGT